MLFQVYTENGVKKIKYLTADTGTGAPVGSIIVVCSNILPSGYLGLGVQYDITNYPALYQVLGTDTTPTASALGLPTLSSGQYAIKATSGLTENQQENVLNTINENLSYSTTEHKTGKKWIDGKDIYSKVVDVGNLPNTTGKAVAHSIQNVDYSITVKLVAKTAEGVRVECEYGGTSLSVYMDNINIHITTQYDFSGYSGYAILEYTKTV